LVRAATPAVEVHVYPAEVAGTLARAAASATYDQNEPDGAYRAMHPIGTVAAGPGGSWREMLRAGATAGTLTAVAISDPRQVRPEHRVDDRRWQQVARQVAITVDPRAPWVAFRTRPDAIVLFAATTLGPEHADPRHLAAAASRALRQEAGPEHRPRSQVQPFSYRIAPAPPRDRRRPRPHPGV
jgi:hypothetical protein